MAIRCRSPPESVVPRVPISASSPLARRAHDLLELRLGDHRPQRVLLRVGRGVAQVVAQGAGQHGRLLLDVAELGAQLRARPIAQVAAREDDSAGVRVVEALEQRKQRRLPRPEGPTIAVSPRAGTVKETAWRTGGRSSP